MRPHRIFIVEDQNVVREMLARYLDLQPDLEVSGTAGGGEEALRMLPGRADVVLIDMELDGMTGAELLAAIRQRWPTLPCVIVSGRTALESGAAMLDAGASAYVEKGDLRHLLSAIRGATTGSAHQAQGGATR